MGQPMTIVKGWKDSSIWSTENLPSAKQFDRWCAFVNEAHLNWSIKREDYDSFPAFIREGRFDDFRIANLTAHQPFVKGNRTGQEIRNDSLALYNIIYIMDGAISLHIDGNDVDLHKGDIALWDSTRPMGFVTGENLHQLTLAVSHERMHRVFPTAGEYVGRQLSCSSGLNRLLADHLLSLDLQFGDLTSDQAWIVLEATLNMAISAFGSDGGLGGDVPASDLLRTVRRFIDDNIDDFDLSIAAIAGRHNISVRHLHRLFHDVGITASAYINRRRLERCKHDLASRAHRSETITDVAFRWGFNDSGTFSKTFRREYGVSPREYRAACAAGRG